MIESEINTVGKTPLSGHQWSVGVAYVALPSDIDRDVYIRECYQNSRLSLWSEDAGFLNRVPIDNETINYIEFPLKPQEFGTAVVYVTESIHKQPIAIASLQKIGEIGELREYQFKIKRKLGNKFIEISGSAKNNTLNLVVNSESEKGSINIHLLNSNNDGELNLEVDGDVNVSTTGKVQFIQKKRFYIETTSEDEETKASFEQTEEANKFQGKKFIINEGEESMVLGNKLVSFLEDFIDEVAAIQTITNVGPQPILNKIQVLALKGKLNDLLSQEGYLKS